MGCKAHGPILRLPVLLRGGPDVTCHSMEMTHVAETQQSSVQGATEMCNTGVVPKAEQDGCVLLGWSFTRRPSF